MIPRKMILQINRYNLIIVVTVFQPRREKRTISMQDAV